MHKHKFNINPDQSLPEQYPGGISNWRGVSIVEIDGQSYGAGQFIGDTLPAGVTEHVPEAKPEGDAMEEAARLAAEKEKAAATSS